MSYGPSTEKGIIFCTLLTVLSQLWLDKIIWNAKKKYLTILKITILMIAIYDIIFGSSVYDN